MHFTPFSMVFPIPDLLIVGATLALALALALILLNSKTKTKTKTNNPLGLTPSLTHSLTHSLTPSLPPSLPPTLPPRVGPSMWQTVSRLTTIHDLSSLHFIHNLSKDIHGIGKTTNGTVFCLNMPQLFPFIVSTDYKLARLVLEGNSIEHISAGEKSPIVRAFDYTTSPSILTHQTSSPDHHKNRKHLAVSFSSKNLEYTQKVMKECLQRFGSILQDKANNGTRLMLENEMVRLTLDIISESAFGVNFNTMIHSDDNLGEFYMQENELFLKEGSRSALNPLRKLMFWDADRKRAFQARDNVMQLAHNLIKNYRMQIRDKAEPADDKSIMGRLMSCDYDSDDTRAQDILIMLLGGHETSSHTVSYLILCLLRNPDAKTRLQQELDTCISSAAFEDTSLLNCTDIMNLPFLAQCLKESMRLLSVIGGGPKRILTQNITYEGMFLPKGSMFVAAFYSMFRQPWIDSPEDFIPDRWSDSNPQHAKLKDMLMSFGAGKRQCIGQNLAKMEVALIAGYVLRFFDFKMMSEPNEELFLTAKPVDFDVTVNLRT